MKCDISANSSFSWSGSPGKQRVAFHLVLTWHWGISSLHFAGHGLDSTSSARAVALGHVEVAPAGQGLDSTPSARGRKTDVRDLNGFVGLSQVLL